MNIKAEYVNKKEDFQIVKLMGSLTLCYGTPGKKNWKGVAFKDLEMAR